MTFNLVGFTRGYLTVLSKEEAKTSSGRTQWRCRCLCGNITVLPTYQLSSLTKYTKSCGHCNWHIEHKDSYVSWMAMKQRCDNRDRKDYKYYGGRGISYDPRWDNFVEFYIDMGDPPTDSLTCERMSLDRKDVNGNYTKENCKWSTRSEQQLNRTDSVKRSV